MVGIRTRAFFRNRVFDGHDFDNIGKKMTNFSKLNFIAKMCDQKNRKQFTYTPEHGWVSNSINRTKVIRRSKELNI